MPDNLTKQQRSRCMAQIKSKNSKPEAALRKWIWKKGYRYRIGGGLPGKPDMLFSSSRLAVFIDGCFWHGCPKHCRMPLSNTSYWIKKIAGNKKRDKENLKRLRKIGWRAVRVWEHEVKKDIGRAGRKIIKKLDRPA